MQTRIYTYIKIGLLSLTLAACGTLSNDAKSKKHNHNQAVVSQGFFSTTHTTNNYTNLNEAANSTASHLVSTMKFLPDTDIESPIITMVVNYVELDRIKRTSPFGRTVSEQIAASLSDKGMIIREVKLKDSLVINEMGEFMLSREIKELAHQHNAKFVVVGTYTEAAKSVFVTSKLVMIEDGNVVSAFNFTLEKDLDISSLLHGVREKDKYPEGENDEDGKGDHKSLMESIQEYDQNFNVKRKKYQYK